GEMTSSSFVLDGLDPSGNPVPEGKYLLSGTFTDRAGNSVNKQTEVTVDLTPPSILVTADPTYFSPEGDGIQDTTTVSFKASEPVSGQVEIVDPSGKTIYSGDIPQITSGEVVLDGLSSPMMLLGNGTYTIRGKFSDAAGNRVEPEPLLITRDDRPTTLRVAAVERIFSPDGDGVKDKLPIAIEASVRDGIKEWTVTINDANGRPVKVLSGSDRLPEVVEWDGSADGGKAAEGTYSARVKVEWRKGSIQEGGTEPFTLDVTPPSVKVSTTASPFIKTDGEIEGEAFITLQVEDESGIEIWSLDILTKTGGAVRSYAGDGDPSDLFTWKGETDAGRIIGGADVFLLKIDITDKSGNKRAFEQPLPIDVIVYRKDGKLHLIVPNIIFGAYKHTLDSAGKLWMNNNLESIKWVRDILSKYPNYGIELDAHALNIYRGNPAKEAAEEKILGPLTERRAAEVKKTLIELGINEKRIKTEPYGGKFPIVSTKDREVYWKNRRVEFIMTPP
ncbi:MAG TPA: hypothetical protein VMX75_14870, partial [Spirochaetia bacterium]|nr:hypothetical protein [Spirochaetia bacterium]